MIIIFIIVHNKIALITSNTEYRNNSLCTAWLLKAKELNLLWICAA
jgi:hypothetical protein